MKYAYQTRMLTKYNGKLLRVADRRRGIYGAIKEKLLYKHPDRVKIIKFNLRKNVNVCCCIFNATQYITCRLGSLRLNQNGIEF